MRLPVNTRSACRYHDIQPDVDDKEIPRQIDLSEYPQAQQRAQDRRYSARCADRDIWAGVRNAAHNPAEHGAAERGQGEVERLNAPREGAATEETAEQEPAQ